MSSVRFKKTLVNAPWNVSKNGDIEFYDGAIPAAIVRNLFDPVAPEPREPETPKSTEPIRIGSFVKHNSMAGWFKVRFIENGYATILSSNGGYSNSKLENLEAV